MSEIYFEKYLWKVNGKWIGKNNRLKIKKYIGNLGEQIYENI